MISQIEAYLLSQMRRTAVIDDALKLRVHWGEGRKKQGGPTRGILAALAGGC